MSINQKMIMQFEKVCNCALTSHITSQVIKRSYYAIILLMRKLILSIVALLQQIIVVVIRSLQLDRVHAVCASAIDFYQMCIINAVPLKKMKSSAVR